MARSSTEQKWLERRRHHNERVWDFRCSRKIHARAWHPLYYEGDAMEVECERPTPLSIYRCNTYRKEIVRQRHVAEIEGQESLKVGDSLLAVSYTHLRAHETPEQLVCRFLL